jgi:hypothetical protein
MMVSKLKPLQVNSDVTEDSCIKEKAGQIPAAIIG